MLYIVSNIKLYSIIDFQDFEKEGFCTENSAVLQPNFVLYLLFQRMQAVA